MKSSCAVSMGGTELFLSKNRKGARTVSRSVCDRERNGYGCVPVSDTVYGDTYAQGFAKFTDRGWDVYVQEGKNFLYLGRFGNGILRDVNDDWYFYREKRMTDADSLPSKEAIGLLRDIYVDPDNREEWSEIGLTIAADKECLDYFADYWSYLRWNEHGNECSLAEVGFGGLVNDIIDPWYVLDYLGEEEGLKDRLVELHMRYSR